MRGEPGAVEITSPNATSSLIQPWNNGPVCGQGEINTVPVVAGAPPQQSHEPRSVVVDCDLGTGHEHQVGGDAVVELVDVRGHLVVTQDRVLLSRPGEAVLAGGRAANWSSDAVRAAGSSSKR